MARRGKEDQMSRVQIKKPIAASRVAPQRPQAPSEAITLLSALIAVCTVVVVGAGLADAVPRWMPASEQLWLTAAAYGVPALVVALIYSWVGKACRD
jgi:hypothetical protein